jgi:hypothetical protein
MVYILNRKMALDTLEIVVPAHEIESNLDSLFRFVHKSFIIDTDAWRRNNALLKSHLKNETPVMGTEDAIAYLHRVFYLLHHTTSFYLRQSPELLQKYGIAIASLQKTIEFVMLKLYPPSAHRKPYTLTLDVDLIPSETDEFDAQDTRVQYAVVASCMNLGKPLMQLMQAIQSCASAAPKSAV